MELEGVRVLLGITGGIAAYKAPWIVRRLQEEGAQVRVARTAHAARFVTDETLSVLSGHPVHGDLFAATDEFPVLHIGLAKWADLLLVAPATANLLGKLAAGIADDLLTTIYLSTPAPVLLAPAMEADMLAAPRVQGSIEALRHDGVGFIEPETGPLASGASGKGRMPAPERVVEAAITFLQAARSQTGEQPREQPGTPTLDLAGRRILVTAGPTVEDLDPVRFLTNRSSGKMGYAVAERARARGAEVELVHGPTNLAPPAGVHLTPVRSTVQMHSACLQSFDAVDAAIMAAAPSDYRPREVAAQKLKRSGQAVTVELVENPDVAADLGARKGDRVVVAFAMETEDGRAHARDKLARKQADLIVLNNLTEAGAGFAVDTNRVTLIDDAGQESVLPLMSKHDVADRILDVVRERLARRRGA